MKTGVRRQNAPSIERYTSLYAAHNEGRLWDWPVRPLQPHHPAKPTTTVQKHLIFRAGKDLVIQCRNVYAGFFVPLSFHIRVVKVNYI